MTTRTVGALFGDIKIAHTLFALPFALLATGLALTTAPQAVGGAALLPKVIAILTCMFGARTWAMAINRYADAQLDGANPRTAQRALPSGRAAPHHMLGLALFGGLLFAAGAAALSRAALACSLPVMAILASYSYMKRFTWLCHFWLGLCLGLAPVAAWLALRGVIHGPLVVLGAGIMFWVGGFDIVYALQDEAFDRKHNLRSIPAAFGTTRALTIARCSHAMALVLFAVALVKLDLAGAAAVGVPLAGALLLWQHLAIAKRGERAIPFAFFNLNAWIAIGLLVAAILDVTLRKGIL